MTATPVSTLIAKAGALPASLAGDLLPEWVSGLNRWTDGPFALLAADLVAQRFLMVGGNVRGVLGYDADQLARDGMRFYTSLNHSDDEATLGQIWSDLLELAQHLSPDQRQGLQWTLTRRFRHADGSFRWILVQMKPLAWDHATGTLLANLGVLTDVSHLHLHAPPAAWVRYPDSGRTVELTLPRQASSEVNLTLREREVLRLVAQGFTSAEIATKLYISKETVDTHRKRILAKTHVKNTAELVRLASRLGLV